MIGGIRRLRLGSEGGHIGLENAMLLSDLATAGICVKFVLSSEPFELMCGGRRSVEMFSNYVVFDPFVACERNRE